MTDDRWDPMSGQPPRYRHTPAGMVLDPEGAYVLAHMALSQSSETSDDVETVFELLIGIGVPGSLAGAAEDRILEVARRQAARSSSPD